MLHFEQIKQYREHTFRLKPGARLHSREEAVEFVQERGYVHFWPITGALLPNLWTAVAGDRPVADAHDDPGHVTWGWKDSLLGQRDWYYAKLLRKKATMVSMQVIPYFYALSENYGAYEEDYLTQYEQGRLTQEAKQMYETLLKEGPLDTVALRRASHLSSAASEARFTKALSDLQGDLKIVPVGVTQAGAWHYAFAYDVLARHYPEIPEQAHAISDQAARKKLTEAYYLSLGAAPLSELSRLFGWKTAVSQKVVEGLATEGLLVKGVEIENQPGEWIALKTLA